MSNKDNVTIYNQLKANCKNLKSKYDLFLCMLEDKDKFPYSNEYPCYFKSEVLDEYIAEMGAAKDAYDKGAGGELKAHKNKKTGKIVPPKMLSVASSSRFCYLLFRNGIPNPEIFGQTGESGTIEFEKELPILDKGTPPHMDAYYNGDKYELFFECKCHEFFDSHGIQLSKSYKDKLQSYFPQILEKAVEKEVTRTDDNGNTYKTQVYEIEAHEVYELFNVKKYGLCFDIKQLLTHLMGIISRKEQTKPAKLIYIYNIPQIAQEHADFKAKIKKLFEQAKSIFESEVIRGFATDKNIELSLFVYNDDTVKPMSAENLTQIIPSK